MKLISPTRSYRVSFLLLYQMLKKMGGVIFVLCMHVNCLFISNYDNGSVLKGEVNCPFIQAVANFTVKLILWYILNV